MKKDFVFIDLDGTLVNTSRGIYHSLAYCFEKMGLPVLDESEMSKYIGPPLMYSFTTYAGVSEEDGLLCCKYFREAYSSEGVNMHELYDGVEDMLVSLKAMGKTIAVATSKPEMFAKKIMQHYKLDKYFTAICGATLDESRSSKKDVLAYAVEKVGVKDLSTAVLVGDTENDVIGAKAVGMDCIGILYGFGTKEKLLKSGAEKIVATPYDVIKLFE